MPGSEGGVQEIYVQPGESRLVRDPAVLRTVLGSCVGITFLVPRLGIGALCHPMLPRFSARRRTTIGLAADHRYVDAAIHDMARHLDSLGAERGETQVKLFGGADVLTVAVGTSRPTVGELNRETALRVLTEEGFSLAASSVGGNSGVQILFQTRTGEVLLRRLKSGPSTETTRSRPAPHGSGAGR